jgi:F-box and leucine-rich repeat protein 10/11
MYLHALPAHKKNVPDIIPQAVKLITDVRDLVQIHRKDNPNLAVTGKCILRLEVIKASTVVYQF